MPKALVEERRLKIPEGVSVSVEGKVVKVSGPLGELKRDFSGAPIEIALDGDEVVVTMMEHQKTSPEPEDSHHLRPS